MVDLNIDTSSPQYTALNNGLDTLRTVLTPRVKILRDLPPDKQRLWLQRDPLMLKFVRMVRDFQSAMEINE